MVTAHCPNCGASVSIRNPADPGVCPFCDSHLMIDDNTKAHLQHLRDMETLKEKHRLEMEETEQRQAMAEQQRIKGSRKAILLILAILVPFILIALVMSFAMDFFARAM